MRVLFGLIIVALLAGPVYGETSEPVPMPANSTESPESAARLDSLFLFAATGPGSYGSPGTDERGFTFDGPLDTPAPAGWVGVDLSGQEVWWHVDTTGICAGTATDMSEALPFDPGDTSNDYALWCGLNPECGWMTAPGYGIHGRQRVLFPLAMPETWSELRAEFVYRKDFPGEPGEVYSTAGLGYTQPSGEQYAWGFGYNSGEGPSPLHAVELTFLADDFGVGTTVDNLQFYFQGYRGNDENGSYD